MIINNLSDEDWDEILNLISKKNALPNVKHYIRMVQLLICLFLLYAFTFVVKTKNNFESPIYTYFLIIMFFFFVALFMNASIWKDYKTNFLKTLKKDDFNIYFVNKTNLDDTKENIIPFLSSDVPKEYQNKLLKDLLDWRWVTSPNLPKYTCSIETEKYFILVRPIYKQTKFIFSNSAIIPIKKSKHNIGILNSSEDFKRLQRERILKKYTIK